MPPVRQPLQQAPPMQLPSKLDAANKVVLAIIVSDGDNMQVRSAAVHTISHCLYESSASEDKHAHEACFRLTPWPPISPLEDCKLVLCYELSCRRATHTMLVPYAGWLHADGLQQDAAHGAAGAAVCAAGVCVPTSVLDNVQSPG